MEGPSGKDYHLKVHLLSVRLPSVRPPTTHPPDEAVDMGYKESAMRELPGSAKVSLARRCGRRGVRSLHDGNEGCDCRGR